MTIEYVSGDLFLNRYNVQAFAHGCNCQGSMSAGIAATFHEQYPEMYKEYHQRCKAKPRLFNLGDTFLWTEANKPSVFNLGTQERPGRDARYDAIETALTNMKAQANAEYIESIAIPRIGAGIGGLSWDKVKLIIDKVFENWAGALYVYEEYIAGK
jgi:O-acetyl-ADP-ribose deacetylase (regulator of RNase III)